MNRIINILNDKHYFVKKGKGGLFYRPPRKMIGRGYEEDLALIEKDPKLEAAVSALPFVTVEEEGKDVTYTPEQINKFAEEQTRNPTYNAKQFIKLFKDDKSGYIQKYRNKYPDYEAAKYKLDQIPMLKKNIAIQRTRERISRKREATERGAMGQEERISRKRAERERAERERAAKELVARANEKKRRDAEEIERMQHEFREYKQAKALEQLKKYGKQAKALEQAKEREVKQAKALKQLKRYGKQAIEQEERTSKELEAIIEIVDGYEVSTKGKKKIIKDLILGIQIIEKYNSQIDELEKQKRIHKQIIMTKIYKSKATINIIEDENFIKKVEPKYATVIIENNKQIAYINQTITKISNKFFIMISEELFGIESAELYPMIKTNRQIDAYIKNYDSNPDNANITLVSYDSETNSIVANINTNIDKVKYPEITITSIMKKLFSNSVDVNAAKQYWESLGEKWGGMAEAKLLEYAICGRNNKTAASLFDIDISKVYVQNPEVIISNVVQELNKTLNTKFKDLGGQFIIDTVDLDNCFFNEMKNYTTLSYEIMYNLNRQLKERFKIDLKKDLKKLLKFFGSIEIKEEEKRQETLQTIKNYEDILTNRDAFDAIFYKEREYLGVGVTYNKFNKVPDNQFTEEFWETAPRYDPNNPNYNKKLITLVRNNQGQKFAIDVENRFIIGARQIPNPETKDAVNEKLSSWFKGGKKFKYYITVRFSNVVATYPYTTDELVKNDNVLGTYKTVYASDWRPVKDKKTGKISQTSINHFNGVLIPIEKFILKAI